MYIIMSFVFVASNNYNDLIMRCDVLFITNTC